MSTTPLLKFPATADRRARPRSDPSALLVPPNAAHPDSALVLKFCALIQAHPEHRAFLENILDNLASD